jgi:MOSC domain-containing protein YiiM
VRILSVNLAGPRPIQLAGGPQLTGIYKQPVSGAGVGPDGLIGDAVVDGRNHGGPDQAVYLYSWSDYQVFAAMGLAVAPALFGENLTVDFWDYASLRIGDRLVAGTVELELAAPRIPCAKLAARVGRSDFVRTFTAERRFGAYARVLRGGEVAVSDQVVCRPAQGTPTLLEAFDLFLSPQPDPALLRALLAAPVAQRIRARYLAS